MFLVDFDNVHPPGSTELSGAELRHSFLEFVELVEGAGFLPCDISVRLYGGWMSSGVLSRRGSEVAATMAQADPFPLVRGSGEAIRGNIELAVALMAAPDVVLDDTYRRRMSVPRLRLSKAPFPSGCQEHQTACPARILTQFTRAGGRLCPADSCGVTSASAFIAHEQKMVDTLLACDLLAAVEDDAVIAVFVVSGDTDFLPPLLFAASRGRTSTCKLSLVTPSKGLPESAAAALERLGVTIMPMRGDRDGT